MATLRELLDLTPDNTEGAVSNADLRAIITNLDRGFVQRVRQTLYDRNGDQLKLLGVNRYNLIEAGQPFAATHVRPTIAGMASLGINCVRFWFFQEQAELVNNKNSVRNSADSGSAQVFRAPYLTRLRAVIAECKRQGLYVIPVFGNHFGGADGSYGTKDASWYGGGYLSGYGGYPYGLHEFAAAVAHEFKDEPTIAFWQVMNEAEAASSGGSDLTNFQAFADTMGQTIRAADPNHLISFGTMGLGQNGMSLYDTGLHDEYDLCDMHDYNEPNNAANTYLATRSAQAAAMDKPFIITESGISTNSGDVPEYIATQAARATAWSAKLDAFWALPNAACWLAWSFRDTNVAASPAGAASGFEFNEADPFAAILAAKAAALNLGHP